VAFIDDAFERRLGFIQIGRRTVEPAKPGTPARDDRSQRLIDLVRDGCGHFPDGGYAGDAGKFGLRCLRCLLGAPAPEDLQDKGGDGSCLDQYDRNGGNDRLAVLLPERSCPEGDKSIGRQVTL
jgi:hypothetical protein